MTFQKRALTPPPPDLTARMRLLFFEFKVRNPNAKTIVMGAETRLFFYRSGLIGIYRIDGIEREWLGDVAISVAPSMARYEMNAA